VLVFPRSSIAQVHDVILKPGTHSRGNAIYIFIIAIAIPSLAEIVSTLPFIMIYSRYSNRHMA